LKRPTLILTAAARFVLSMNCEDFIRDYFFAYKLICTSCSPEKQPPILYVHGFLPMKSRCLNVHTQELFTTKTEQERRSEQVPENSLANGAEFLPQMAHR
jgi:hypothetical protein